MLAELLSFRIPSDQVKVLRDSLGPEEFHAAMQKIVKKTMSRITAGMKDETEEETAGHVDRQAVAKTISRKMDAAGDKGVVTVRRSKRIPLADFDIEYTRGGGVHVRIAVDLPIKNLRFAFLARMPSGHEGAFLRTRRLSPNPVQRFGRRVTRRGRPFLQRLTPAGFAGRLSIEEQRGPTVARLVAIPPALERVKKEGAEFLQKQTAKEIAALLAATPKA